jgi:hypothetical protein
LVWVVAKPHKSIKLLVCILSFFVYAFQIDITDVTSYSLYRLTHTLDDFTIILALTSKHNQLGILYKREDLASQGSGFFCGEFEGVGLPLVVIA